MVERPNSIIDFSAFIVDRTRNFTGREWVLDEIDRWLADPGGPSFYIITGGPGSGKSAVAARLTQVRDLAAYHFCIVRRADTINPFHFARSLSQQLCRIDGFAAGILEDSNINLKNVFNIRENYGHVLGAKIANLIINAPSASLAFNHAVTQPLKTLCANGYDQQIVILVDALDEAIQQQGTETIIHLLANAGELPRQARIVLTSRPEGAALGHFKRVQAPRLALDAIGSNNEDDIEYDIREYIRLQLSTSVSLQTRLTEQSMSDETFVERVAKASKGNFLYLVWLLTAIAQGSQRFDRLEALPQGLEEFYREFLRTRRIGDDKQTWRKVYRPVLGLLAVAQAPLMLEQLAQFSGLPKQDVDDCIEDIQQFLDPTAKQDNHFQLYHNSYVDFLGNRERADDFWIDLDLVHQSIVTFYRDGSQAWEEQDWGRIDDYGLRYLAAHLEASDHQEELHRLLAAETEGRLNAWYQMKDAVGNTAGYLADIRRAWRLAKVKNRPNARRLRSYSAALDCRYALIVSTLNSLTHNIPPAMLQALVRYGIWASERGLAYARQFPHKNLRAQAMAELIEFVDHSERLNVFHEALETLRFVDDDKRKDLLVKLFSNYPAPRSGQFLKELFAQRPSFQVLSAIEPTIPPELLEGVLDGARQLGAPPITLATIAHRLPESQRQAVFQEIMKKADSAHELLEQHSCFLALAIYESTPELDALRDDVFETARQSLHSSERVFAEAILKDLLPYLPPTQQSELLDELLRKEGLAYKELAVLAARAPLALRERVLSVALRIDDQITRLGTLADLACYLEGGQRDNSVQEVMKDVLSREGQSVWLADNVERLAPYMSPQMIRQALAVSREHKPSIWKSKALTDLAATLSGQERDQALRQVLESIRDLDNVEHRIDAYSKCAPLLSKSLLLEALNSVQVVRDEAAINEELSQFLIRLPASAQSRAFQWTLNLMSGIEEWKRADLIQQAAPHLTPQSVISALGIARGFEHALLRARTLLALYPRVVEGERPNLLEEAGDAIVKIDHAKDRAECLLQLTSMAPPSEQSAWRKQAMEELAKVSVLETAVPVLSKLHTLFPDAESELAILEALQHPQPNHKGRGVALALAPHLPESAVRSIIHNINMTHLPLNDRIDELQQYKGVQLDLGFLIDRDEEEATFGALTNRLAALGHREEASRIMMKYSADGKRLAGLALSAPYLDDEYLDQVTHKILDMKDYDFQYILVSRTYETRSIGRRFISNSSAREYILAGIAPDLAKRGDGTLL